MKDYKLIPFVEELLIPDLRKMVDEELHYYAFAIICQATELLGGVFDKQGLESPGESETRFTNGLRQFFRDRRYINNQTKFYRFVRGSLIHQLRPGSEITLSSEKKDRINRENHLKVDGKSKSTFLVIEQFLDDFEDAFDSFKKMMDKRPDLDHAKLQISFVSVFSVEPPVPKMEWDRKTNTTLTTTPSVTGDFGAMFPKKEE